MREETGEREGNVRREPGMGAYTCALICGNIIYKYIESEREREMSCRKKKSSEEKKEPHVREAW